MSKKVKIHPNERVDIPDFEQAAFGYAEDADSTTRKRTFLSRRPLFMSGFRIEVADQTANPGELTVYNGHAMDYTGRLLYDESSSSYSQSVTLVGAGNTFYLEVEYAEEETDSDDRGIWDPTYDNGTDLLGKEFTSNVTTRITPTWTIVSPVSTSGFDFSSNPDSTKIPLAIITLSGSGEIDVPSNPGLSTSAFASVLEEEAASGQNQIRVLDASLFPGVSGSLTVGFGGSTPETLVIQSIDSETGVISFTTNLTNTHSAGAIVSDASSGRDFLDERTSQTVGYVAPVTHPDVQRRLFRADEDRGAVVQASKYTVGDRDDLSVQSLKDYVDFLAAQVRELKFGSASVGGALETPTIAGSSVSSARYYDFASSVVGSRTCTYTIGDGTNSHGDFNGTNHTPFQDAINAAVAAGFTSVSLFVKEGTYSFTAAVSCSLALSISAEDSATIQNVTNALTLFNVTGGSLSLSNVTMTATTSSANALLYFNTTTTTVRMNRVTVLDTNNRAVLRTIGTGVQTINITDCYFGSDTSLDYYTFYISGASSTLSGVWKNVKVVSTHANNYPIIYAPVISGLTLEDISGSYAATGSDSCFVRAATSSSYFNVRGLVLSTTSTNSTILRLAVPTEVRLDSLSLSVTAANSTVRFVQLGETGGTQGARCSITNFYFNATDVQESSFRRAVLVYNIRDFVMDSGVAAFNYDTPSSATNTNTALLKFEEGDLQNIKISNVRFFYHDAGTGGNCIYAEGAGTATLSEFVVDRCVFVGGAKGIYINDFASAVNANVGSIIIRGCTFDGKGSEQTFQPADSYAIHLVDTFASSVEISNCSIEDYASSNSAAGILVADSNTFTSSSTYFLHDNKIHYIGYHSSTTNVEAYGISVALGLLHCVKLHNNLVSYVKGDQVAGLSSYNVSSATGTLSVCGNTILSLNTTSGDVATFTAGIWVYHSSATAVHAVITSNEISGVAHTSHSSGTGCGILFFSPGYAAISDNTIDGVALTASDSDSSASILVLPLTSNKLKISGNILQSVPYTGVSVRYSVAAATVYAGGLLISDNVITATSSTVDGVILYCDRVDADVQHVVISCNNITNLVTAISFGIRVSGLGGATNDRYKYVSILNNSIVEPTTAPVGSRSAIFVYSSFHTSIQGNTLKGWVLPSGGTETTRCAIRVSTCQDLSIRGNHCFWNLTKTTANMSEISVTDCSYVYIICNSLWGKTTPAVAAAAVVFFGSNNRVMLNNNSIMEVDPGADYIDAGTLTVVDDTHNLSLDV